MATPIANNMPRSVRAHLIVFGAAISLPLVVLLGVMLFRGAQLERDRLESQMLQVASNLGDDVDREIDRRLAMLQTLATSPSLAEQDWQAFYAQAPAAAQGYGYIILVDNESRQIVNTFVPYGTEPPLDGNPESVRDAVEMKRAVVSNLFISLVTHKPVFNIRMPILDGTKVRYVLSLGLLAGNPLFRSSRRSDFLTGGQPAFATATMLLSHGRRAMNVSPARKCLLTSLVSVRWIVSVTTTSRWTGTQVSLASALSERSGWRIDVHVPVSMIEAPLRASLVTWIAASILAILLAIGLALIFARKFEQPFFLAAKAAEKLGSGTQLSPLRSRIIEANVVMDAMRRASAQLAERDRQQHLLMRELTHRVKNILAVVQAVVTRGLAGTSSGRSRADHGANSCSITGTRSTRPNKLAERSPGRHHRRRA